MWRRGSVAATLVAAIAVIGGAAFYSDKRAAGVGRKQVTANSRPQLLSYYEDHSRLVPYIIFFNKNYIVYI